MTTKEWQKTNAENKYNELSDAENIRSTIVAFMKTFEDRFLCSFAQLYGIFDEVFYQVKEDYSALSDTLNEFKSCIQKDSYSIESLIEQLVEIRESAIDEILDLIYIATVAEDGLTLCVEDGGNFSKIPFSNADLERERQQKEIDRKEWLAKEEAMVKEYWQEALKNR